VHLLSGSFNHELCPGVAAHPLHRPRGVGESRFSQLLFHLSGQAHHRTVDLSGVAVLAPAASSQRAAAADFDPGSLLEGGDDRPHPLGRQTGTSLRLLKGIGAVEGYAVVAGQLYQRLLPLSARDLNHPGGRGHAAQ